MIINNTAIVLQDFGLASSYFVVVKNAEHVWQVAGCLPFRVKSLCLLQVKVMLFSEEISMEARAPAGNSASPVYAILSHAP